MRSAVSSGDIHLIENERLVALLFSWEDLVLDSHEDIENIRNYAEDTYLPLIDKYAQVREINTYLPHEDGSSHPSDFIGLFKDPLFENYTLRLYYRSYRYTKELKDIRENNVEILKWIDEELKS